MLSAQAWGPEVRNPALTEKLGRDTQAMRLYPQCWSQTDTGPLRAPVSKGKAENNRARQPTLTSGLHTCIHGWAYLYTRVRACTYICIYTTHTQATWFLPYNIHISCTSHQRYQDPHFRMSWEMFGALMTTMNLVNTSHTCTGFFFLIDMMKHNRNNLEREIILAQSFWG